MEPNQVVNTPAIKLLSSGNASLVDAWFTPPSSPLESCGDIWMTPMETPATKLSGTARGCKIRSQRKQRPRNAANGISRFSCSYNLENLQID